MRLRRNMRSVVTVAFLLAGCAASSHSPGTAAPSPAVATSCVDRLLAAMPAGGGAGQPRIATALDASTSGPEFGGALLDRVLGRDLRERGVAVDIALCVSGLVEPSYNAGPCCTSVATCYSGANLNGTFAMRTRTGEVTKVDFIGTGVPAASPCLDVPADSQAAHDMAPFTGRNLFEAIADALHAARVGHEVERDYWTAALRENATILGPAATMACNHLAASDDAPAALQPALRELVSGAANPQCRAVLVKATGLDFSTVAEWRMWLIDHTPSKIN